MKKVLKKLKKIVYANQTASIITLLGFLCFIVIGLATSWSRAVGFGLFIIVGIVLYNKVLTKMFSVKKKNGKLKITYFNKKDDKIHHKIEAKKDHKNKKDKKSNIWKKLLIILFTLVIIGFIGLGIFFFTIVKNAPDFDPEKLYTKEATILYDDEGNIFAKIGSQKREKISFNDMPEVLVNAIVATEDSRFFQHNGFDLPRFVKATLGQVLGNSSAGGASTITMQVAKNSYTSTVDTGVQGIMRKFTDIYLSIFKIEKNYTKEEILEFYANSYYMGGSAWGVEQACLTYFGKSAKDINLSEAALIAGLFQSPGAYNPLVNPDKASERRNIVLTLMVRHGYITQEEKEAAASIAVEDLLNKKTAEETVYQGFLDTVVSEVKEDTGLDPYTTPMKIYTTMKRANQDYLDTVMSGAAYTWENESVDAGISVLNTQTGAIVAIGTGRNTEGSNTFNNATQIKKQIGSTAKPLYDYGPGIEYNNWSTYQTWADEEYTYSDGKPVTNWDGQHLGLLTSRAALAGSRNIPALRAFQSLKNSNVKEFVTNLGLSPEIESGSIHEAHAIGGYNGESPLSMSAAYSAFANGGYYNEPFSYTKITLRETDETIEQKGTKTKAMSASTAYMINDMLITTSTQALRNYANVNNFTFSAKTGTTNFSTEVKQKYGLASDAINDLWVVGMTDEYAIAVWYGYEKVDSSAYTHFGNSSHLRLFQTVAKGIFTRSTQVANPGDVVSVTVESGLAEATLPSAYTPNEWKVTELFKKGTEPTTTSTRFSQLKNPTNLSNDYSGGTVTLDWSAIDTPDAIDEAKITDYYSKVFKTAAFQSSYTTARLNYNANYIGNVGYDVYTKVGNTLTLIGSTTNTTLDYDVPSTANPITFVVKSAYTIFKTNASTGVETTTTFSGSTAIIKSNLIGDTNVTINKNSTYTDTGKGVLVSENGTDVTSTASVVLTIKDASNKSYASIASIDFSKAGTYTLTYTVSYKTYHKTHMRQLVVQ